MSTLEKTWAEMKNAIERSSFRVFPNHLDVEGFPRAYWPTTSKPDEFLALGKSLGISLVYVAEETFIGGHVSSGVDEDVRSDDLDLLNEEAREHAGDLIFVAVWWVKDGVVHEWSAEADWYLDYQERLENVLSDLAKRGDVPRERDISDLAEKLATNEDFQKARTPDQRAYIARKLFPELETGEREADWGFFRLVRQAQAIYEVDILPAQERDIADKARVLMTEGTPRSKTAEQLGISDDRLKRILQTNPSSEF